MFVVKESTTTLMFHAVEGVNWLSFKEDVFSWFFPGPNFDYQDGFS